MNVKVKDKPNIPSKSDRDLNTKWRLFYSLLRSWCFQSDDLTPIILLLRCQTINIITFEKAGQFQTWCCVFSVISGTIYFLSCLGSCYRPQRSWGKVMFLHVSVILFTGLGLGVWLGGSRPRPRGKLGVWPGGVSRPRPRGEVGGLARQCPGPHQGGSRPTSGGFQAQGVYPSMHWGRHPPTATAAGGMHPTGTHSKQTSIIPSCNVIYWPRN